MSSTRVSPTQLTTLGSYSTCEVSDALLKLKVPHGGYVPDIEVLSQGEAEDGRVVGEAYTVKMVDQKDVEAPKLSGHFVDLAPAGSIMFISTPPHVKSASFGGLLGTAAHYRGVKGVVIDGRCRDLSELRALHLPVFARGHSTLGQSPFTRPSQVQIPLTITPRDPDFPAVLVRPGDLVLADIDGVVVVGTEMLEKVLELAKKGREVDELCRVDLLEGKGVGETFKARRGK